MEDSVGASLAGTVLFLLLVLPVPRIDGILQQSQAGSGQGSSTQIDWAATIALHRDQAILLDHIQLFLRAVA